MPEGLPNQPGSDDFRLRVYRDEKGFYVPASMLVGEFVEGEAPVPIGPSNPLPSRPVGEYLFSSSVASLANGEEIDSGWFDLSEIGKYQIEALASAGGMTVTQESSTEADGAGVARTTSFITDNGFVLANFPARQRYMRTRFINNTGGPLTDVALAIKVQYGSADQHSVFPLSIDPQPFSQAALVQAVGKGQAPDGSYDTVPADGMDIHTETELGIGGVFESPWKSTAGWRGISVFIGTSQESAVDGIEIEFTDQPEAGTPVVRATKRFTVHDHDAVAGVLAFRVAPQLHGYRLRYTNGGVATGSPFLIHTHLLGGPVQLPTQLIEDPVTLTTAAATMRAVLAGKAPGNGFLNVAINDGTALLTTEFEREVGRGNVPGFSSLNKFGRSASLANGDTEDIWHGGGDYTGQPLTGSPETLTITSLSNDDSVAGVGMQQVKVTGLRSSTSTEFESVIVDTGGIAGVTTPGTWWRVIGVEGVRYGSGGAQAGDLTVQHTTTTANIFAVVPAPFGKGQVMAFTVPAGKTGYITSFFGPMARTSGAAGSSGIAIMIRPPGQLGFNAERYYETTSASPASPRLRVPIEIPAGSDVKARAIDVSDNLTFVMAEMDIMFVDII